MAAKHPLDPLTSQELADVASTIKTSFPAARFVYVALAESNKSETIEWVEKKRPIEQVSRLATATTLEQGKTIEYIINVRSKEIVSRVHHVGFQAGVTGDEYEGVETMLKSHPELQKALRRRGIVDMSLVMIDLWTVGYFSEEDGPKRRQCRPFIFYKISPEANGYGCPVEGLSPVVDLDTMTLIRIEDHAPDVPLPPYSGDYADTWRTDPPKYQTEYKKLQVVQPDGPSYTINGNVVTWLDWNFHVGFNPREGVSLNLINFQGRSVAYRLSLAEFIVPYSYPRGPHARKNAFDVGEEGVGNNAKTLRGGCDCIGSASFLSASLCASDGSVVTIPDVVCIHEEDYGILWKHTDWRNNRTDVRRNRTLIVSFWATVANYDYGFSYRFCMDGTIEVFSELTGILSTAVLPPGLSSDKYGQLVAPSISATYHQHFFTFRIDPAIDGWTSGNTVFECDSTKVPAGPENPLKNLFQVKYHTIKTEKESGRVQDQTKFRHWVVMNTNKKTSLGLHPAYAVMPYAEGTLPFHDSDSFLLKRAPFLSKALWVTAFNDKERFPAGPLPNQQEYERNGMTAWVAKNRPLENTDVVMWYTMGVHHIPRPEEWPIMPAMKAGWRFVPFGFSSKNPCANAPPPACIVKKAKL